MGEDNGVEETFHHLSRSAVSKLLKNINTYFQVIPFCLLFSIYVISHLSPSIFCFLHYVTLAFKIIVSKVLLD